MSKNQIFRKSSLDRVSSPEKLNDYIKVSNPSVWLVILALFVLLAIALIWSSVGTLPTKVKALGLPTQISPGNSATQIVCYVDEKDITGLQSQDGNISDNPVVSIGQDVEISPTGATSKKSGFFKGKVIKIGKLPVGFEDLVDKLGNEALARKISGTDSKIEVIINLDGKEGNLPDSSLSNASILNVQILVEKVSPNSFLFN